MMMDKRLLNVVPDSKKYIMRNVLCQWGALAANIVMMWNITALLASLLVPEPVNKVWAVIWIVLAVIVRYVCTILSSRMSYLSSKAVKKTLREKIYQKLLRLGVSYKEQVKTSEIVQVAVEGVDQLETYFGAYLPQFFYAMIAPLTLFVVLCFVNVRQWDGNTWVKLLIFTEEVWILCSRTMNVKLHRPLHQKDIRWYTTGCITI